MTFSKDDTKNAIKDIIFIKYFEIIVSFYDPSFIIVLVKSSMYDARSVVLSFCCSVVLLFCRSVVLSVYYMLSCITIRDEFVSGLWCPWSGDLLGSLE